MAGKLDDYVPVNERVQEFHRTHPEGIVTTEVLEADDQVVRVKATVFRTPNVPLATGHAEERRGKRDDKVLEKCESTAVGRALALGGFLASKSIASREEMESFHSNAGAAEVQPSPTVAAKVETISASEAGELESYVREWLASGDGNKRREKLKMKLISLGVSDPNAPLVEVLGQIPSAKKAAELMTWLGEQDNAMTAEELADALIEEGVAVEKAA
jgi:hypothetical protein